MEENRTLWSRRSKSKLLFAMKQWVLFAISNENILPRMPRCLCEDQEPCGEGRLTSPSQSRRRKCQFIKEKKPSVLNWRIDRASSRDSGFLKQSPPSSFYFLPIAHLALFLVVLNLSQLVTSVNLTLFQMDLSKLPLT